MAEIIGDIVCGVIEAIFELSPKAGFIFLIILILSIIIICQIT